MKYSRYFYYYGVYSEEEIRSKIFEIDDEISEKIKEIIMNENRNIEYIKKKFNINVINERIDHGIF
jgi:uncharacterized protein (UPF0210 family)